MLEAFKSRVQKLLSNADDTNNEDRPEAIRLATATLLAEVACADGQLDDSERKILSQAIQSHFGLPASECESILNEGLVSAERAVSLQGFTRTLHEALSVEEKSQIIGLLWQVAAADGVLDKHEDARIAQLGELLYVPRAEVLRLKHIAGL